MERPNESGQDSRKILAANELKLEAKYSEIFSAREAQFAGSKNPRQIRALSALLLGQCSREQLDHVVGCTNSPDLVIRFRKRGLDDDLLCKFVNTKDRYGRPVEYEIYCLTERGRLAVLRWAASAKVNGLDGGVSHG